MKKIHILLLTIMVFVCIPVYGDSLKEISDFAENICGKANPDGKITREQVKGELGLDGKVKGSVLKFLVSYQPTFNIY